MTAAAKARARDAEIRADPALRGRAAYEASLGVIPTYADGTPRPKWERLSPTLQQSWERAPARRDPTPPEHGRPNQRSEA